MSLRCPPEVSLSGNVWLSSQRSSEVFSSILPFVQREDRAQCQPGECFRQYPRLKSKVYLLPRLSARLTVWESTALSLSICESDCSRLHPYRGLQYNRHKREHKPAMLESQRHPGGWLLQWLQTHPGRNWVGTGLGASLKASKGYSVHMNTLLSLRLIDSSASHFITAFDFVL